MPVESVNALECADLSALWPVATCRDFCLSCPLSRMRHQTARRPKRRQGAALQRVDVLLEFQVLPIDPATIGGTRIILLASVLNHFNFAPVIAGANYANSRSLFGQANAIIERARVRTQVQISDRRCFPSNYVRGRARARSGLAPAGPYVFLRRRKHRRKSHDQHDGDSNASPAAAGYGNGRHGPSPPGWRVRHSSDDFAGL